MTTSEESRTRRPLGRRFLLGLLTVAPAAAAGGAWSLPSTAGTAGTGSTGTTPARDMPIPAALRPGGEFDRYLSQLAAEDRFSGTVLVTRDGRPVLSRSFGYADKRKGIRNRADTIYCLASVTKLFTAIAVAQLAQRGSLTLLDPIGKHSSGFAAEVADRVTIHHLLTHTSGLGDFMRDPGYFEEVVTWTTPEQMMDGTLRYVRTESLAFAPGAGSTYSNSGYHVLGCIIQKVSGQSYYDYIREHVFRPAGMTDSDFTTLPQWKSGSRYAHPYPTDQSGTRNDALDGKAYVYIGNPAGNAFATAADLVRFARALNGGTLLNAVYREIFLTPKLPRLPRPDLPAVTPFASYAPDNFLINGRLVVGRGGAAPGVTTGVDWYPGTGWTAVNLSNYDRSPNADVNQRLRQILTS
ncbi:beta-lactamase family protein [Plantactinospora sp. S1510]|uniref:Beta-lactamase family protein n=1 Tax=Plantactinospora alkalitolerans TaxID=2789879 RepID=A0ABS0GU42_9ACTN|nr:serine hydrolase domain-containing protein [Plantactinospora alkalitolerans]MBF9129569.1 beta-lactamase family protein [Plantactinospora alkalitolerans]